jgi:hypothetical protein
MHEGDVTNEPGLVIEKAKTALLLLHWQKDIASPEFKHSRNMPERLAEKMECLLYS